MLFAATVSVFRSTSLSTYDAALGTVPKHQSVFLCLCLTSSLTPWSEANQTALGINQGAGTERWAESRSVFYLLMACPILSEWQKQGFFLFEKNNNYLNQNIAALKLIRLFLIMLENASKFSGLLLKCPKPKWIVLGRKYLKYFSQLTTMSFFQAVWKSLMKDHEDSCCARKMFLQKYLPCLSLPRGSAEPGTRHQPLPPMPLENNDFHICCSFFFQKGKY